MGNKLHRTPNKLKRIINRKAMRKFNDMSNEDKLAFLTAQLNNRRK